MASCAHGRQALADVAVAGRGPRVYEKHDPFAQALQHVVAVDGVYVAGADGQPVFRALGRLKTDEVADVLQITKARVLKALARRGVVRVSPEVLGVDDALANRDPVLAQLAAAAVAGLPPAGPAERKREPVAFATGGGLEIVGDLVVQDCGFNLHAKTRAGAADDEARAHLLRYVLRPPLAQDRLAVRLTPTDPEFAPPPIPWRPEYRRS